MKRKISIMLVMVMALTVFSANAFAVAPNENNQGDGWVITTGRSISYVNEEGETVVDELESTSEFISQEEMAQGYTARASYSKTINHIDRFVNDQFECALGVRFVYVPGESVGGAYESYSVKSYDSRYVIARKDLKPTVKVNNAQTQCTVSYTFVGLDANNRAHTCKTWISCTRSGVVGTS